MENSLTFDQVIEDMEAFVGIKRPTPARSARWESNFGGDRVSYHIDQKHIQNIFNVVQFDIAECDVFNQYIIERWKVVNALLVQNKIEGG